jgi:inorganic pyrophosphatase
MQYIPGNPWHIVSVGSNAPDIVRGVMEIPKGSRAKYELDKETGLLKLDRVLYSAMYYPANYGFIPQTYCDDHDPLDILVLSQIKLQPMCLVDARPIGVMRMLDNNEADDKIIAVAAHDMSVNHVHYKKLEHKTVVVEEFQNRATAHLIIQQAIEDYRRKFGTEQNVL